MGAWARALGLKSTSSLSKVLNGEREAGPELVEKLIQYFKFNATEQSQFRQWVTISKLKESSEVKTALAKQLETSGNKKDLKARMLEIDQYELLSSVFPLAMRELTRVPAMKIARLKKLLPQISEKEIERMINALTRLGLVKRDSGGAFVACDDHINTTQDIPNDAIQMYHESALDQAKIALKEISPEARNFESLVFLIDSTKLHEAKEKIRAFISSFEIDLNHEQPDQAYQMQIQLYPISQKEKLK